MLCDLVITFSGWDIPVQGTGAHSFGVYIVVYIEFERNETFIVCLSCNEGLVPLLYIRENDDCIYLNQTFLCVIGIQDQQTLCLMHR